MFTRRKNGGTRTKKAPSQYSPGTFHFVRLFSFLSALVVSSIMFYFCYHLRHDHFKIPWTFIVLFSVSLLTLVTFVITTIIHLCHRLSPRLNLLINAPLLVLWALGFALLTWNMTGTLTHICNNANWGNSDGVMICRIYKALFSFTCVGFVAAVASVALDIRTRRREMRLGKYSMMGAQGRDPKTPEIIVSQEHFRGEQPPQYSHETPYGQPSGFYDGSNEMNMRTMSPSHHLHDGGEADLGKHPAWRSQGQIRAEEFGYTAPVEQTRYDAGYSGR